MVHSVWVTIYKMVKTGFKLSFTAIIILRTDARMCHKANTNLLYIMIFYRRGKIWRPPIGDKIKVHINMRLYTEHLQHSRLLVVLYRCVNARKKRRNSIANTSELRFFGTNWSTWSIGTTRSYICHTKLYGNQERQYHVLTFISQRDWISPCYHRNKKGMHDDFIFKLSSRIYLAKAQNQNHQTTKGSHGKI